MSPEYDPTTNLVTVRGPVHARLVLNALGIRGADSRVDDPHFSLDLIPSETPIVIAGLDKVAQNALTDPVLRESAHNLGDDLFMLITRSGILLSLKVS